MKKLVAFDLDGTLINSLEDLAASSNYALRTLGFPEHTVDEYRYLIGNGVVKLIERALPPEQNSGSVFDQTFALFRENYRQNYCNRTRPYPQMTEVVEALQHEGYLLAVLSNKLDLFVRHLAETLFPSVTFDYLCGATDTLPHKPAPDSLLACMQALHVTCDECVYCGDSDVDVIFAHRAGVPAIGVSWGFRGREELSSAGADFIIDEPNALINLLKNLN